jgi:hypothetical protein
VRAGPGFTRKVFEAIEREESGAASPLPLPSANVIAAVSAGVILGVLAVVAYFVIPGGGGGSRDGAGAGGGDLAQTYFVTPRAQTSFIGETGAEWPAFGPLAVEANRGLRPAAAPNAATNPPTGESPSAAETFRGGGVLYARTLPADQPFAVEASVRINKPSDDVAVQVFVSDTPSFDGSATATSPHELVWLVRGGAAAVALPDGTVETPAAAAEARVRERTSVDVRIAVNRTQAAVEMNGKRLWAGANQLDPNKRRTVGIRFLTRGPLADKDRPVVESVRILAPQKQ